MEIPGIRWLAEIPTTQILGNFSYSRCKSRVRSTANPSQVVVETVFVIPSYRDTPFSSAYRYYRSLSFGGSERNLLQFPR